MSTRPRAIKGSAVLADTEHGSKPAIANVPGNHAVSRGFGQLADQRNSNRRVGVGRVRTGRRCLHRVLLTEIKRKTEPRAKRSAAGSTDCSNSRRSLHSPSRRQEEAEGAKPRLDGNTPCCCEARAREKLLPFRRNVAWPKSSKHAPVCLLHCVTSESPEPL
jgi:hypothetical protein